MKLSVSLLMLITAMMVFGTTASARHGQGFGNGCQDGRGFMTTLTVEQRTEIRAMVCEMRQTGEDRDVIHEAVKSKLESFGIEVPAGFTMRQGHKGTGLLRFDSQLTEQQREEIQEMRSDMRQNGSSREEIHHAVGLKLESFGIELPEGWEDGPRKGHRGAGHFHLMGQLNEVQRAAVRSQICEMRQSGASRLEIRAKVQEMAQGYGIELPCQTNGQEFGWGYSDPDMLDDAETFSTTITATSHPNPFNPDVTISYTLQDAAQVQVQIYDLQGQLVRTVKNGHQNAGSYEVVWNGLNANGKKVSSGTYFYQINAGDQTLTKQIIMAK